MSYPCKDFASFAIIATLACAVLRLPVAQAGEPEAYQHLADRMDLYFQGQEPRLIESYMAPYPPGPDGTLQRIAFTYDNALAVMTLVNRGTPDDLNRAKLICDALVWYQQHDVFADGRFRQAYRADQNLTTALHAQIPTAFAQSYTGDLAWAGLALLTYFERVRDPQITDPLQDPNAAYLQAAITLANFVVNRTREPQGRGMRLGFAEVMSDMTVGVPIAQYTTLTTSPQQVLLPLSAFTAQGLNPDRLRAVSLVFGDPAFRTGTITFNTIKLVNPSTGTSLVIDNFSDTNPVSNSLGFQIGGIVDISSTPSGRTIRWNSADGSIDYWYSLLVANPGNLPRLDAGEYTHLLLDVSGAAGGERFTVELQGYPLAQRLDTSQSTEHNLDAYVLFMRLFALTGTTSWRSYANEAKAFVEQTAWDATGGKFWGGTFNDSATLNQVVLTVDQQALVLLALGRISQYGGALDWVRSTLGLSSDGFTGFDYGINVNSGDPWYSPTPDGVWFEGTAQMASAYEVSGAYGGTNLSSTYLGQLDSAQANALNHNGKSLVAASHNGVTTGYPYFSYFSSGHIGATAWYLAAKRHVNFYWNTSTDQRVPYDRPPVLAAISDKTATEGQLLTFAVSATDPDSREVPTLTARLANGDPLSTIGATFTDNHNGTGAFTWTPDFTRGGANYLVMFEATDSENLSASQTITIAVTDAVPPPPIVVINVPALQTAVNRTQPITVSGTATAAPGVVVSSMSLLVKDISVSPAVDVLTQTISITSGNTVNWTTNLSANLAPGHKLRVRVSAVSTPSSAAPGAATIYINPDGTVASCYVLSAAYGNPYAPEIQALWAFHDRMIPLTPWHQRFLIWYDHVGPQIAAFIQDKPTLKALIRGLVTPVAHVADAWLKHQSAQL